MRARKARIFCVHKTQSPDGCVMIVDNTNYDFTEINNMLSTLIPFLATLMITFTFCILSRRPFGKCIVMTLYFMSVTLYVSQYLARSFQPGFYVLIVLTLALFALRKPDGIAAEYLEMTRTTLEDIGLPFLCIPIFLAVYGDEFKSGTLQCVIGRGLSRPKVVIAKLLDAAILLGCAVAAVFFVIFIRNSFSNLAITPRQNLHFLYFCVVCVLRGVGYMALSSLVMFLTWSAAAGTVTLIICSMLSSLFLRAIQDWSHLPLYDLSYEGLLNASCTAIQAGKFGWQLIPALVIYLGGVVWLNILIFNRKELEL